MAFRFGDPGGRMYVAAGSSGVNILAHWTSALNAAVTNWSVVASGGRLTGTCLRQAVNGGGQANALLKTLDAQATLGVAFGFRTAIIGPASICGFLDGGSQQVDVVLNADLTLSVTRNGTLLGQSTVALRLNAYHHIELKVTFHPTAGTAELRVNGVARVGPLSSINTRNTANSSANQVAIGSCRVGAPSGPMDFDDVIVWDGQANDANGNPDVHDFVGDCGLAWLLPTGAGTTTQFTPDSGSNYARVNEATPDGDTSYAQSSTVGQIDTYAAADLGGSVASVKSVAVVCYAGKTDSGSRGLKAEVRSAGANASHATEVSLSTTYGYAFWGFGQDPGAGSPVGWTPTSVNALEVGQIVSS